MRASEIGPVLVLATSVLALVPSAARAQPADPEAAHRPAASDPSSPALRPPEPRSDTAVAYPEGATGDHTVILVLTVGIDGQVREVKVERGDEPFAAAASTAASTWRFEPATRGGAPVAARIRFEVRFNERPSDVASDEPSGTPDEDAPQQGEPAVREVLVEADRSPPGAKTVTRAEARQLPGAFGDPLRAIEVLPGVTPVVSGVPYFFVRGAPPGNVGYYLDGVRVPALYHLAFGPSVLNPGILESVDLYPGGYPARYGRFAGAIVAATTNAPRTDLHGEARLRLIDAGGFVEGGLAGGRGTALVGGRYSYTGLALSLASSGLDLQYWDYQTRVSYDVGSDTTVGVFALGSLDRLRERVDGRMQPSFVTEFHRLDLRLAHEASSRTRLEAAVTLGLDRGDLGSENVATVDRIAGSRAVVRHRASDDVEVRFGYDALFDFYELERDATVPEIDATLLFPTRRDAAFGLWADTVLDPHPRVTVTPGLRVDLFTSEGASAVGVDPRVAALFRVKETLRLIHTFGIAHQPPSYLVPLSGLVPSGLDEGLQRSIQSSAGVEWDLVEATTLSVTGYQSIFLDMTDNLDGSSLSSDEEIMVDVAGNETRTYDGPTTEQLRRRTQGSAVGVEVGLRRPLTRRLGGFLSYTLSRSLRSFQRSTYPAGFDRTHVLNLALGYQPGKRWHLGTRFVAYSGVPSTRTNPDGIRPRHPRRLPPLFRLDLRAEKRWKLGDRGGYWSLVFELLNATLSRDTTGDHCEGTDCTVDRFGPLTLPSIGVEAFF